MTADNEQVEQSKGILSQIKVGIGRFLERRVQRIEKSHNEYRRNVRKARKHGSHLLTQKEVEFLIEQIEYMDGPVDHIRDNHYILDYEAAQRKIYKRTNSFWNSRFYRKFDRWIGVFSSFIDGFVDNYEYEMVRAHFMKRTRKPKTATSTHTIDMKSIQKMTQQELQDAALDRMFMTIAKEGSMTEEHSDDEGSVFEMVFSVDEPIHNPRQCLLCGTILDYVGAPYEVTVIVECDCREIPIVFTRPVPSRHRYLPGRWKNYVRKKNRYYSTLERQRRYFRKNRSGKQIYSGLGSILWRRVQELIPRLQSCLQDFTRGLV